MIRYLVLGFLVDGEPRHGYALLKEWRSRLRVRLNSGSFYRELRILTRAGLIAVHEICAPEDARRTSYVITAEGRREFASWLRAPMPELHGNEDELAARAQFLDGRDRPADLRLLSGWQDRLWLEGKLVERERDEITNRSESGSAGWLVGLLLTRRIARVVADLELLTSLREGFESSMVASGDAADSGGQLREVENDIDSIDAKKIRRGRQASSIR